MKPTINVNRGLFCDWYFDSDIKQSIGIEASRECSKAGKFSINLNDIYKRLGYIPLNLINNKKIVRIEHIQDECEIEEPSVYYKVKWVGK